MTEPLISIAPLMGYSDHYFCYLMSLIAPHAQVYSEMIHTNAVIHGGKHRGFAAIAPSVILQLGGSDPDQLVRAAVMAQEFGFAEINLNIGCPSARVQTGSFGACLMKQPLLVAECLDAMRAKLTIPVSVKCRIGVDDHEDIAFLYNFINHVVGTGCSKIIIHARKALLKGLSPKQNRTIPPLDYQKVYQVKADYPDTTIIINGGIRTQHAIETHLASVDGVMLGRWAIEEPWAMRSVDHALYRDHDLLERSDVVLCYLRYIQDNSNGCERQLRYALRHLQQIFRSHEGAKSWRRLLSTIKHYHECNMIERFANTVYDEK